MTGFVPVTRLAEKCFDILIHSCPAGASALRGIAHQSWDWWVGGWARLGLVRTPADHLLPQGDDGVVPWGLGHLVGRVTELALAEVAISVPNCVAMVDLRQPR